MLSGPGKAEKLKSPHRVPRVRTASRPPGGHKGPPPMRRPQADEHRYAPLIVTFLQLSTRNFLLSKFSVLRLRKVSAAERPRRPSAGYGVPLRGSPTGPAPTASPGWRRAPGPARRDAGRNPAPSRDAAAAWAAGLRIPMSVLQYLPGPWAMRCQCF